MMATFKHAGQNFVMILVLKLTTATIILRQPARILSGVKKTQNHISNILF